MTIFLLHIPCVRSSSLSPLVCALVGVWCDVHLFPVGSRWSPASMFALQEIAAAREEEEEHPTGERRERASTPRRPPHRTKNQREGSPAPDAPHPPPQTHTRTAQRQPTQPPVPPPAQTQSVGQEPRHRQIPPALRSDRASGRRSACVGGSRLVSRSLVARGFDSIRLSPFLR